MDFEKLVPWLVAHGYLFFFLAVLLEGVIATIAGGVIVALGHFNPFILFLLATSGCVFADTVYYWIGYAGRKTWGKARGRAIRNRNPAIARLDAMVWHNLFRSLLIVKLSFFIPVPGLLFIGSSGPPFRKYFTYSVLISASQVVIYLLIGYLTGEGYHKLSMVIRHDRLFIFFGFFAFLALVVIAYRIIADRIARKL